MFSRLLGLTVTEFHEGGNDEPVATDIFSKHGEWRDLSRRETSITSMGVAQRNVVPRAPRICTQGWAPTSFCSPKGERAKGPVAMICQRCLSAEARFRAASDVMNIAVCVGCGEEAQKLGIAIEPLPENSCTILTDAQLVGIPSAASRWTARALLQRSQ